MFRFILVIFVFLLSLLTIFPPPAVQLWYTSVAVTEFSWIFGTVAFLLLAWSIKAQRYKVPAIALSLMAFFLCWSPVIRAYIIADNIDKKIENSFGVRTKDLTGFHQDKPFSFIKLFTGNRAKKVPFTTYQYANHTGIDLSLNFYPSMQPGIRPCLVVVHGGSWTRSSNAELPDVNSYFANAGYQVASINYRLAPQFTSPAPQEDLHAAMTWLRNHASALKIDTSNFVLMGRSAGGQIVLTAAYTFNDPGIKGVVSFYGPTDMLWSYDNPANSFIYDSKKVLRDFLGGSPDEVRQQYIDASPVDHVNAQTVPTLLVQGKNDAHVWLIQSERLQKKLDQYKVKNLLLALPWATHGCEYSLKSPSGQLAMYTAERFFFAVTQKRN